MTKTEMRQVLDALTAVKALIKHQYTGSRDAMNALQNAADDAHGAISIMQAAVDAQPVQPSQAGELSDAEILSAWSKHTLANDYEKYTLKEHVLRAGKEIIAAINAKGGQHD